MNFIKRLFCKHNFKELNAGFFLAADAHFKVNVFVCKNCYLAKAKTAKIFDEEDLKTLSKGFSEFLMDRVDNQILSNPEYKERLKSIYHTDDLFEAGSEHYVKDELVE